MTDAQAVVALIIYLTAIFLFLAVSIGTIIFLMG